MEKEKRRPIHPNILFPGIMLLLEGAIIVGLLLLNYELTPILLFSFVLVAGMMLFRIVKHLRMEGQVLQAVHKLEEVDKLAASGKPMEAVLQWKYLLHNLPRVEYLQVLSKIEKVYEEQAMSAAVQQVKAIVAESKTFFEMTRDVKKVTAEDQRHWQAQATKLREMIDALPTHPGQTLEEAISDE